MSLTLFDLPDEVLLRIAVCICDPRDLWTLACTCRRLSFVVCTHSTRKTRVQCMLMQVGDRATWIACLTQHIRYGHPFTSQADVQCMLGRIERLPVSISRYIRCAPSHVVSIRTCA